MFLFFSLLQKNHLPEEKRESMTVNDFFLYKDETNQFFLHNLNTFSKSKMKEKQNKSQEVILHPTHTHKYITHLHNG